MFTAVFNHPFKVVDASDGEVAKVRVVFGQVNSATPNIGATPLDDDPAPTLAVVSGVVYLQVNLDEDGLVTSAEIGNAAELPDPTDTEGYITLATVTVTGAAVTAINQSVTHSLQHMKCGVETHLFGAV